MIVGTRRASPQAKPLFSTQARGGGAAEGVGQSELRSRVSGGPSGGLAIVVVQHAARTLAAFDLARCSAGFGARLDYAEANPSDGQAQFDSLYAQGYVTWLTNLKPAFVANATAVAQAAGNDEVALVSTNADLADQEATDNVNALDTQEPQSADESQAIQTADDTYQQESVDNVGQDQIGSAEADQTQMLDLAQAASTYLVACAQADKQHAIDAYNDASDTDQDYTIALANAQLALTDSQADADQAWITGKAQAEETFLTTDAEDWQTMSDGEAETSDEYALTDDSETQSADDTVAGQEAGTITAEAQADQTQGNADAAAEGAFQIAQANETSTVWTWLAGQLGNTPWAQSQAGLAGAEASWAVTAAANYQAYVAALGTAEIGYANSDSAQFDNQITTIDGADKTAADDTANTDLTLATTLTDDEAAFEETLATAGVSYQIAIGQSAQDYRQGVAQADHDLTVETAEHDPDAQTDFNNEMAAAQEAKTAATEEAYANFATLVAPAMTLEGTDDANAEKTDSETDAGFNETDIQQNNQAVDGYDDQESADYDTQQRADALGLDVMQVANANGLAGAIAAYDSANPSPWADLAAAQAAAQAAQQVSQAAAQLVQSYAQADAQEGAEQAQADATTGKDNAQAEAEETQTDSDAEAADATAVAQAAATDTVFTYLPDTLIAPSDGPVVALTPDYLWGYEANDFYLYPTSGTFGQAAAEFGIGWVWFRGVPDYPGAANFGPYLGYDWGAYRGGMLLGLMGNTPGNWDSGMFGTEMVTPDASGGGVLYGNPIAFTPHDLVRSGLLPVEGDYQPAMHGGSPEVDIEIDIASPDPAKEAPDLTARTGGIKQAQLNQPQLNLQAELDKATVSEEQAMRIQPAAYSWMTPGGQQAMKDTTPSAFTPTGWNVVDMPLTFIANVGLGTSRAVVLINESVNFYVDAGAEVLTRPSERQQFGAAWQATTTDPLAETLLERAKDNGNSNPGAIELTFLGLQEVALPINPAADAIAGYDRIQERRIEGFERAERILVAGSQITGAAAGTLRVAGGALTVTGVLAEGAALFTLQNPLAPPTIPATRIAGIRSALTDANGSRLTLAERDGIVFTIRRVEGEGYRLAGSVKYNTNQGIDLEFTGVQSNSGRIALAEAKAGTGLNSLEVDANGVRQGSLEFFRSRAMRAGRLDLVDALDAGNVDAFGGFSESGKLYRFNLTIFVDDVNFKTTPGAATLVPP
jgi:hypothetical protein